MNITQLFIQLYNTGILALAIALLAIAIIVYAQIRYQSPNKKK